jgi:hypothetical protein
MLLVLAERRREDPGEREELDIRLTVNADLLNRRLETLTRAGEATAPVDGCGSVGGSQHVIRVAFKRVVDG